MAGTAVNGSTSSPHKHKKRKERPSDFHLTEESHHHKKKKSKDKHRHAELEVAAPEVVGHHVSKKKGKRKMEDEDSAFAVVSAAIRLSIPPVFVGRPLEGVEEMLDSMVMNGKGAEETDDDETLKDSTQGQHEPAVDDPQIDAMGRWVKRDTRERVGGPNLMVEFTVVGMILANQMISLIGSLQPDPLDPRHSEVAAPSPGPHPVQPASESEEEEEDIPPPPPPTKKKKKDKKSKESSGSRPSA
ncbi:hypothetical protein FS837_009330 [Tulasnella sp. UAMH 9824]|nr:hypothetical protein FS837_009330 [Tulasnella sp. UAMH 9824]